MSTRPAPPQSFESALSEIERVLEREPGAALNRAEALLKAHPDPRLFRLAAEACRRLGRDDDAVSAELVGIQAGLADPDLGRAAIAQSEGRWSEGLAIAEGFLRQRPNDLLALMLVAEAQLGLWQLERAEQTLRSILERAPTFLRAATLLATCLVKQVRVREACAILEQVIARKPNNVTALAYLAQLREEVGDADQSLALREKLVALEQNRPGRWVDLAHSYRMIGRSADAVRAFRQALALDPANESAWWSLANYFVDELDQNDEQAISDALGKSAGTPAESGLQLALGLIKDRQKKHEQAFRLIAAGKTSRSDRQAYDAQAMNDHVNGVIRAMTPQFYRRRSAHGDADSSAIFIVGMPRSGTTLVERILGRHSAIEAAGELPIFHRLAERVRGESSRPDDPAALLESLSDVDLARVGERYMAASGDYRHSGKPRFIDKSNLNWMNVGLIMLSLPNAKIIDVRRDALDCCWANFKVLFPDGFPEANDLRHMGRFYSDYARLMDAMQLVAPARILKIGYEDVVQDVGAATRRMLEFLDLQFEAACLDFHLSTDAVATPSSEQVRRPLNRKGIGSSRPYRQWLGPLIEELGPLAAGT